MNLCNKNYLNIYVLEHFGNIINNVKWSSIIWVNRNDGIVVAFWWGCGSAFLVVVMRKACMCRWVASRSLTVKIFLFLSSQHPPPCPRLTSAHTCRHTLRREVFCSLLYSAHETDVQEYTHTPYKKQCPKQSLPLGWACEGVHYSTVCPSLACVSVAVCSCLHMFSYVGMYL